MSSMWSLVLFTLMTQAAAGLMIIFTIFPFLFPYPKGRSPEKRVIWTVLLLLVSSLAISFLHLGSPLNGINAFRGLESSWLSKEILALALASAFTLFTLILTVTRAKEEYVFRLKILTIIMFIALTYSMIRVYMIPARPLWNSWATPAGFILSALISGIMVIQLLQRSETFRVSRALSVVITLLMAGATGVSLYCYGLMPSEGIATIVSRVALSTISIAILLTTTFGVSVKNKKPFLVVIMVVTALLSELAGRIIYFNLFDFSV